MNLFSIAASNNAPLAYRMRPRSLDQVVGQEHIIGPGTPLRIAIENDNLSSLILYGPPGTGKTTIAQLVAKTTKSHFEKLPAVIGSVGDIRKIASDAAHRLSYFQQKTIMFVDEIHRFNKNQQDVLLPFIEDGTLILIGATTENPFYELNNAIMSRVSLYILKPLNENSIKKILYNAIADRQYGLGNYEVKMDTECLDIFLDVCKGDARIALNILDTIANLYMKDNKLTITPDLLKQIAGKPIIRYDKKGDSHYDIVSAYIKSIRGSDPDAALFWLAVMLEGGEDPRFIARRLIVHAAEDIGLADPLALSMACSAASAVDYVGMPEARIPLAEATIYLATAPKSNSTKKAIDQAIEAVRKNPGFTVPPHLADSSHSQAHILGKGVGYKYPHNWGGYVAQAYLPENLNSLTLYKPSNHGYEQKVREYLENLPNAKHES
ncbi:MAG: replication-associated recombination protein A [Syntrophomonadaceae bacterium]|jgi:putative ATPase